MRFGPHPQPLQPLPYLLTPDVLLMYFVVLYLRSNSQDSVFNRGYVSYPLAVSCLPSKFLMLPVKPALNAASYCTHDLKAGSLGSLGLNWGLITD